jgi:hypothetical protein
MQTEVASEIDVIRRQIISESSFGAVAVRDVRAVEESGPDDETYLHFMVYAADPDPASGTWPIDDVMKLRWRVLKLANESDTDFPSIVVDVYPEHEDTEESSDQDSTLARRLDEAAS